MKKIVILFIILILFVSLSAESKWFGKDKIMHLSSSAFLTCWSYGISNDILDRSRDDSIIFAVSFTAALGTGKEYNDKKSKKTCWNWKDIVYNIAGISLGMIIINNTR